MFKIFRFLLHVAVSSFVLLLPVGYETDSTTTTDLTVGVYGGTGQIATIVRGCSGGVLRKDKSSYSDFSGSADMSFPTRENERIILGLKAGRFSSEVPFASESQLGDARYKFTYYNPNVSYEGVKGGIGIGILTGDVPGSLRDSKEDLPSFPASGHVRGGRLDKTYFLISVNENLPLVSGGDYFNLGFGYAAGSRANLFTGIDVGLYDGLGLVQKVRLRPDHNLSIDYNARVGGAEGITEFGISAGLSYRFRIR